MTRSDFELEYLELCDALEREATQEGFERFFRDPEYRHNMKEKTKALPIVCTNAGLQQSASHYQGSVKFP